MHGEQFIVKKYIIMSFVVISDTFYLTLIFENP